VPEPTNEVETTEIAKDVVIEAIVKSDLRNANEAVAEVNVIDREKDPAIAIVKKREQKNEDHVKARGGLGLLQKTRKLKLLLSYLYRYLYRLKFHLHHLHNPLRRHLLP
jgi:hypothetical protein